MNREKVTYYITGGLAIAFGLFIILNPAAVINVAAFVFSIGLVARGFSSLRGMLKFNSESKKLELPSGIEILKNTMLAKTLVSFAIGVIALMISVLSLINGSGGIMKAAIYVIALGFLATGILGWMENQKFKTYGDAMDAFHDRSFIYVLIAVVLFIFPFLIGGVVMLILGSVIILLGCLSIFYGYRGIGGTKEAEAEFTESKDN